MSRWGQMNKKSIVAVLETGLDYLKDMVISKEKDTDILWKDYTDLYKLLYGEGRELLSITNQVKFERKINFIRKELEKGWESKE